MDAQALQEIFHDLLSALEPLDTRNAAILQFLKDKGIATEKDLAPYLESAANTSSVRWLAVRVRIDHLFAGAMKAAEKEKEKREEQDKKTAVTSSPAKVKEQAAALTTPEQDKPEQNPEKNPEQNKEKKEVGGDSEKAIQSKQEKKTVAETNAASPDDSGSQSANQKDGPAPADAVPNKNATDTAA